MDQKVVCNVRNDQALNSLKFVLLPSVAATMKPERKKNSETSKCKALICSFCFKGVTSRHVLIIYNNSKQNKSYNSFANPNPMIPLF